jgi:hypothetical protein
MRLNVPWMRLNIPLLRLNVPNIVHNSNHHTLSRWETSDSLHLRHFASFAFNWLVSMCKQGIGNPIKGWRAVGYTPCVALHPIFCHHCFGFSSQDKLVTWRGCDYACFWFRYVGLHALLVSPQTLRILCVLSFFWVSGLVFVFPAQGCWVLKVTWGSEPMYCIWKLKLHNFENMKIQIWKFDGIFFWYSEGGQLSVEQTVSIKNLNPKPKKTIDA